MVKMEKCWETEENGPAVRYTFQVVHIAVCALMFAAAIVGLMRKPSVAAGFAAFYTLIFASILAFFEISRLKSIAHVELFLMRNFGFLYSHVCKGFFLIFIAFMNLALVSNKTAGLAYAIFSISVFDGVLLIW